MKVTILGNVATIIAEGLKFDDLNKLFPSGAQLVNDKDEVVYQVMATTAGRGVPAGGDMSQHGAVFTHKNAAGDALIQLPIDEKKDNFTEVYADALHAMELNMPEIIKQVSARGDFLKEMKKKITVE